MKTKFLILLTGFFLSVSLANAQASVDCNREVSLYAQSAKIKDYKTAKPIYDKLIKNCPDASLAIYQYGERMFKQLAKDASDDENQEQYAKALIENYKLRLKHFPNETKVGEAYGSIGEAMYDFELGTTEKRLAMFEKAWKEDEKNFSDPRALYIYFNTVIELQDDGKKDLNEVFELYDAFTKKIEEQEIQRAAEAEPLIKKQEEGTTLNSSETRTLKNAEIYLTNFSKIKSGINQLLGERADCENLVPLYNKDFEAKKGDVEWLKRAARRLSAKDCTEDPLFFSLVEALHAAEPSAKSALYLGQLAAKEGKSSKALEYFNQSAELETDPIDKARVYMKIAGSYKNSGSFSNARNYYRKALAIQPSLGIAYLQIASMYASSANNCAETTFDKRAVYWLAADYADRAGRVDPSLKSTAAQTAESYRGRAPQKSDIFSSGKQGQSISFSCWIGESVKVPNIQ
ncbi:hypothetical protein [Mesonia sp. K7]|uniref:hypothetical protein n=1 Tax=Mesonia sp. K7 TaxID=2218606 RepID=UPI000DA8A767|nr:hypothetical protein [Mesonia sp. K7]PZD77786.1 hypothetical protein DNG35_08045 [Mesonia sp. K7]